MTSDWPGLMPHEKDPGNTCTMEKAALELRLWKTNLELVLSKA